MKLATIVIDNNHNFIDQFTTDQSNRDDRIRAKMLIDKYLNQGHFVISHQSPYMIEDLVNLIRGQ